MDERWLPVPGFEGKYEVSDCGRVRGVDREVGTKRVGVNKPWVGRVMSLETTNDGHLRVRLCAGHRQRRALVHNLVLEAFVGPRPDGMVACHDPDPDPANNQVKNLRWDTPKSNSADALKHGTLARGTRQGSAKLTDEDVRTIRATCRLRRGSRGAFSAVALAVKYGVSECTIRRVMHRKGWVHVA